MAGKIVYTFNAYKELKLLAICFMKMFSSTAFSHKTTAQIQCLSTALTDGVHLTSFNHLI